MVSSNETVVLGTIPDIVYKCATIDRIAAIFDSENVMYSFEKVKDEVCLLFIKCENKYWFSYFLPNTDHKSELVITRVDQFVTLSIGHQFVTISIGQ